MREFATVLGGIGFLIGGYLLLKNAGPAATAANGFAKAGSMLIKTLQGN